MTAVPTCRGCRRQDLRLILSLGETPLANALLRADQLAEPEPRYPLDLAFCPSCALVQILETVAPERLFSGYFYQSSFSTTALDNARTTVERLITSRGLGAHHFVIEIASNDGYLLQFYRDRGVPVLGIEPAANVAGVAQSRGVPTLVEFFGLGLARQLAQSRRADVIHANNVLAHVADLTGVLAGIGELLASGGVAVVEVPYVKDLVDQVEFDTIYHEHLCYFSLTSLARLCAPQHLMIADVERIPIHGGSLRVTFQRLGDGAAAPAVERLLTDEETWGVDRFEFYECFGASVAALGEALREQLRRLKQQGHRIAGYGASAKGATLLNCLGIGRETLEFVVDRSTVKQGLFTPGTHLPIYAPDALLTHMPDSVLLLTWNFAEEILAQQQAYRDRGGKFIVPLPAPQVV